MNGTWCPQCLHKNETQTHELFERLTGHKFEAQAVGLFPRNRLWRLDGYCKDIGVAFEYHGKQHYEEVPHFHRNPGDFEKQRARDEEIEKQAPLLAEPIILIVVPYRLTEEGREAFVRAELGRHGVQLA